MQRVHWLNRKTLKIRNVYYLIFILTIFTSMIIGTVQNHFESEAIKKEQAEAQRLLDKKLAREEQQRELAPLLNIPLQPKGTDSGHFNAKYDPNNPQGNATVNPSDAPIEPGQNVFTYRYQTGIYQGMTFGEAYTAWKAKKAEIYKRYFANAKAGHELTDALLDNSKAERSTMLSLLKNLSPKDLAAAEEELIKAYPKEADKLKSFFKDIANATPKSLDDISNDADFILTDRKAIHIATDLNYAESLKIDKELDQVETEKPILPNLP